MAEGVKNFFQKFISGRLGLAPTFWFYGVLIALILNFLISYVTNLWQLILVTIMMIAHMILIVIAVWNASKLYLGLRLWKWIARIVLFLNVFKWLCYLPPLYLTYVSAMGFPIHSSKYWELNSLKLVCEPAEYLHTPEMLTKKYQCKNSVSLDRKVIMTSCWQGNQSGDFLFSENEKDCQEYLTKFKRFKQDKNK